VIDAARKAIEDKTIDSYSLKYGGPGFIVTVAKGKNDGVGQAETEEKAYQAALRDLKKD